MIYQCIDVYLTVSLFRTLLKSSSLVQRTTSVCMYTRTTEMCRHVHIILFVFQSGSIINRWTAVQYYPDINVFKTLMRRQQNCLQFNLKHFDECIGHTENINIGITPIRQSRLYIQPQSQQFPYTVIITVDTAHGVLQIVVYYKLKRSRKHFNVLILLSL